jgi:hypothetical protein
LKEKKVKLESVSSRWNTADIFTKAIPYPRFAECRREMGLAEINVK